MIASEQILVHFNWFSYRLASANQNAEAEASHSKPDYHRGAYVSQLTFLTWPINVIHFLNQGSGSHPSAHYLVQDIRWLSDPWPVYPTKLPVCEVKLGSFVSGFFWNCFSASCLPPNSVIRPGLFCCWALVNIINVKNNIERLIA